MQMDMNRILKHIAHFFSLIFHPLLAPTYGLILLLLVNPYDFGIRAISDEPGKILILRIFLSTFFIPAFAIVMLKLTGLIKTLEMKERQERIGPYIITAIFYLWMLQNFIHNPNIPLAYTSFLLGAIIGLFLAFFVNIFSKISAHAVGMGGLIGLVLIIMMWWYRQNTFTIHSTILGVVEVSLPAVLMLILIVAGAVGSSRLFLQAHRPSELYNGYLVGFFGQLAALRFLLF